MLCFARLIRCAIVASGTKNALAISAVVRPPTARNVRAIADGRVSAGWQHMKRRTSVSSSSTGASSGGGTTFSPGGVSRTIFVSRRRRADSDRI
jgi:hypothetical protein